MVDIRSIVVILIYRKKPIRICKINSEKPTPKIKANDARMRAQLCLFLFWFSTARFFKRTPLHNINKKARFSRYAQIKTCLATKKKTTSSAKWKRLKTTNQQKHSLQGVPNLLIVACMWWKIHWSLCELFLFKVLFLLNQSINIRYIVHQFWVLI